MTFKGPEAAPQLAVVAIGRNEGERLERCLRSAQLETSCLVYVDSASTDGSVAFARSTGAIVVELDLTRPFTAARARNEGAQAALAKWPDLAYLQFVDGDCELAPGWLSAAVNTMAQQPQVAAVCGRRRERHPERSVYNQLCDLEWDTPIGPAKAVGGDALFRASAFVAAGGYRADVIAGEEPELCVRLRQAGWQLLRMDHEMTLHDAAMTRFSQWWTRARRCGYAYALGASLHGAPPEQHWVAETRRCLAWGLAFPLLGIVFSLPTWGMSVLLLAALYPAQMARLWLRERNKTPHAVSLAVFNTLAKFPEAQGVLQFASDRLRGRGAKIIEYK